jgi:hypothetical protein
LKSGAVFEAPAVVAGFDNLTVTGEAVEERFEVHEQTMRIGSNEILTLVLISDPAMLDD